MNVRLDEIKETLKHPNITEHNGVEEKFFMVSEYDLKWLIKQAEMNEQYIKAFDKHLKGIDKILIKKTVQEAMV